MSEGLVPGPQRREHQYPQELWDKLTQGGYHGIGIAEEYGGLGGDIVIQSVFMREFARTAAGLGWIWGITAFSGASAIRLHGSEQQKRQFLPQMAQGRLKTAISFTEPGGGTDLLGGMKTSADKVAGGWVINGEKIWSTTADTADYLLLLARSDKNVAKRSHGISLFFVPRETQGVTVTPLDKLGMRALNSCSIRLDRVFVPDDLLLGEAGKAWKEVTQTLNAERIIESAMCLGMIDGVLEDAIAYMTQRRAFGRLIGEFQALQHYVADMAMSAETIRVDVAPYRIAAVAAKALRHGSGHGQDRRPRSMPARRRIWGISHPGPKTHQATRRKPICSVTGGTPGCFVLGS